MKNKTFEKELTELINRHSLEKYSDTPDYILSHYLCECLRVWNECVKDRDRWWGIRDQWNKNKKTEAEVVVWEDPEYRERRG